MRVIVSGSRTGYSKPTELYYELETLKRAGPLTIVEGCADGVDRLAEGWAISRGAVQIPGRPTKDTPWGAPPPQFILEHWPAEWGLHKDCWCSPGQNRCRFAGPRRNLEMRDAPEGVDRLIAASDDLHTSRGTKNMVTIAHEIGVPVTLIGTQVPVETLDRWVEELHARWR